jgi:hypothetical protein
MNEPTAHDDPDRRVKLHGFLEGPASPAGLVVFVHGSGSSRFSTRNRHIARLLRTRGFSTLPGWLPTTRWAADSL